MMAATLGITALLTFDRYAQPALVLTTFSG